MSSTSEEKYNAQIEANKRADGISIAKEFISDVSAEKFTLPSMTLDEKYGKENLQFKRWLGYS
jgi:hypothetical protein